MLDESEYFVLHENSSILNRAAYRWLMKARAEEKAPHYLYLLSLAAWGLENGAEGDWPERNRYALEEQVNLLFGWKAANVLAWLFCNPNGAEDPKDQESDLLGLLKTTDNPARAAAHILNAIYRRQVSQNPALQPAATELS